MNEIRLIRNQLAAERQHAMAVVSAWAGALTQAGPHAAPGGSVLEAFGQACVEYLGGVLARFDARDERLAELYARLPADDPARGAVNEALAGRGRGCEALERLESVLARHPGPARAGGPSGDCQELVHYFNTAWNARRAAIEALLAQISRVTEWRAIGGIDADSILEERVRYTRVRDRLPAGIELPARVP